jgi:hypothetical protein
LLEKLEKRKFGATLNPWTRSGRPSSRLRHIPAHVKRAVRKREAVQKAAEDTRGRAAAQEQTRDVVTALRELGFRTEQVRRGSEFSAAIPDATLEERVRAALKFLAPKVRCQGQGATGAAPV